MRPILLEKKKWKPEIKDSWMTFFSSIVKVSKKNWLSSSPLQCIVKVFNKSLIFSYVSLASFSSNTDIWYYFSTLSMFNRNTRDEDKNCCNRWWRKVRSRNKTKARSRTRGPTANIRSSTFFGTKISGLQYFLDRSTESIRSSKLVLMLTTFFLSYIWCTRDTCTRLHFVTICLFVFYIL